MRRRVEHWRPAAMWLGRIRQWFLHRVLWYETETCDRCGGKVGLVWWCPDAALWCAAYEQATGNAPHQSEGVTEPNYSGLLCPRCFRIGARAAGHFIIFNAVAHD